MLISGFFVCGFQISLVQAHLPAYIMEKELAVWLGGITLSCIGLFNIFGTLTMGYLADRYSKRLLLGVLYFLRAIIIILFIILPPSNITFIAFGILFGFTWLATVPATYGLVSQIFGKGNLTMLFGFVFLSHQIGAFMGAYLGGYFFDLFGSYDYAWYGSISLSFLAVLIHLLIDEKPIETNVQL